MTKRRKPPEVIRPLEIVDDRNQPEETWIPVHQLPPEKPYGYGISEIMIICRCLIPGHIQMVLANYCFDRHQWRTTSGEVENVTHWQPLPDYPKEYRNGK